MVRKAQPRISSVPIAAIFATAAAATSVARPAHDGGVGATTPGDLRAHLAGAPYFI
jgi:hypothetical protein